MHHPPGLMPAARTDNDKPFLPRLIVVCCGQRGGTGLTAITNRGGRGCARDVGVTVPTVAVVLFQWPGLGAETHNTSDTPGE